MSFVVAPRNRQTDRRQAQACLVQIAVRSETVSGLIN